MGRIKYIKRQRSSGQAMVVKSYALSPAAELHQLIYAVDHHLLLLVGYAQTTRLLKATRFPQ